MSKRILCKFFARGDCQKGDHCKFAHDWNAPAKNICTFYQKGTCSYGSRCKYDHIKVSRPQLFAESSSANSPQSSGSNAAEKADEDRQETSLDPASKPICSLAAAGQCPRGENCPDLHGDLCTLCGKNCLHPFRPQEREEHVTACKKEQKHLEALNLSQDIECNVCLERVLSKPTAAEQRFGLLPECDHPFCLSCIRNWRSTSPSPGMDVNSTLRACPICRKKSFFVVPSDVWYSSKDEKREIIDNYLAKLSSIDCKHFAFGNGRCPFGTRCFYKHHVKPGSRPWRNQRTESSSDGASNTMHLLFDYLYEPDDATEFQEFGNHSFDDSESEDYDDYTNIGSEMVRQMMENICEGIDYDEIDNELSFGDLIANRYLTREMHNFLSSFSDSD